MEYHFISNDGWEHTISDIITIHDYKQETKFCGIVLNSEEGWGYGKQVKDENRNEKFSDEVIDKINKVNDS